MTDDYGSEPLFNADNEVSEYPKFIDFDPALMKQTSLKYIGIVAGLSVLMVAVAFLINDSYFRLFRGFGVMTLAVAAIMFVILQINCGRVVKTITIEQNGFYINDDYYDIEGTSVKIAPFLPIAGKADNIYITVKSNNKTKKYWAGCNDDIPAAARRDRFKSELVRLSPTLVK